MLLHSGLNMSVIDAIALARSTSIIMPARAVNIRARSGYCIYAAAKLGSHHHHHHLQQSSAKLGLADNN